MLTQQPIAPLLESVRYAPCITGRGTSPNKLLLLGEAPGEKEEKFGLPFIGPAGAELDSLLREAGITTAYMTNVFQTRPKANQIDSFLVDLKDWKTISAELRRDDLPAYKSFGAKQGRLHPALYPELDRLSQEIADCKPNLIVALGATALWALTGRQNIAGVRGTCLLASLICPGLKVLPTYHPAAVLCQWDLRSIVLADLMKAKVQQEFPELIRPKREIEVNVSLIDIHRFIEEDLPHAPYLAVDVETRNSQITEIGFAPSPSRALVVPFIKDYNTSYWRSASAEAAALRGVKAILQSSAPKIFQNGLYDIQYIWRTWRFPPANCLHDTMLKHHSLYPEMQKGLGFLGSLYTEEPAWKLMRARKDTVEKRDDE